MNVAYFVPDLNDPTVARRVRLLKFGNFSIAITGFSRGTRKTERIEGISTIALGQTRDSRLVARIGSVLLACLMLWRSRKEFRRADLFMARQLEMLVIAFVARSLFSRNSPLVYECLDIHRLMIRRDLVGKVLRAIERWMLHNTSLLILSSPAYVDNYFRPFHVVLPEIYLLENKLMDSEVAGFQKAKAIAAHEQAHRPWRIGWYGVIRCQASLEALAAAVKEHPLLLEVTIAGRISQNLVGVFDSIVSNAPGLSYIGPYDRDRDLAQLYESVHFTWAIDRYEAGGNSEWHLPNRLFEGGYFRTVMIGAAGTQVGKWLSHKGVGVILAEPLSDSLVSYLEQLDKKSFDAERARMLALPDSLFVNSEEDGMAFAARLAGLGVGGAVVEGASVELSPR